MQGWEMENRYEGLLRKHNQELTQLNPSYLALKIRTAHELKKFIAQSERGVRSRVLEIGIGEGDLTRFLHEVNPGITIDALDVSPEMIKAARSNLEDTSIVFIEADALEYLTNPAAGYEAIMGFAKGYDAIISSWVIHNFPWDQKIELFRAIHDKLTPGGEIMLYDKVYSDDKETRIRQFKAQNLRYTTCLDIEVAEEIVAHEYQDFSPEYRMDESQTLEALRDVGYRNPWVVDRVDRDALIVARK